MFSSSVQETALLCSPIQELHGDFAFRRRVSGLRALRWLILCPSQLPLLLFVIREGSWEAFTSTVTSEEKVGSRTSPFFMLILRFLPFSSLPFTQWFPHRHGSGPLAFVGMRFPLISGILFLSLPHHWCKNWGQQESPFLWHHPSEAWITQGGLAASLSHLYSLLFTFQLLVLFGLLEARITRS